MPVVMIRDGQKSRLEMSTPQGAQVIISDAATGETLSLVNFGGEQTGAAHDVGRRSEIRRLNGRGMPRPRP